MFDKYSEKFLFYLMIFGFGSLFLGIPFFIYYLLLDPSLMIVGVLALIVFMFIVSYYSFLDFYKDVENTYDSKLKDVENEYSAKFHSLEKSYSKIKEKEKLWKKTLNERSSGFPTLFQNISYYENLMDDDISNYLKFKPHPAISSAEIVKIETKKRREAELNFRITKSLLEYYESVAPFLLDLKGELVDDENSNDSTLKQFSVEERNDPSTNFLTKEEYRKLASYERDQLALNRYWERSMSKRHLGKIYERYIGYLYELQGYIVEYTGIFNGLEDLGRDLICSKGDEVVIVQCKNWSSFKRIYEKHIFQFFGTVFQYREENIGKTVRGSFYTTTELSETARRFAKALNIHLVENFKMSKDYTCIKCNISNVDGKRIYHLPFDQQYDNTQIDISKGELYCSKVKEAEEAGFRRAFRWSGNQK